MPESRRLHLLRHAKSSWDDPMQSDHDRPLAPRGRRAVKLLREYAHDRDVRPELTLCSTARRTVETAEGIAAGGEVVFEPHLYSAGSEELLTRIRALPADLEEVMVVGHNPALQMLILKLAAGAGHSADLEEIRTKFPTGALVTLAFSGDWANLGPGRAELSVYVSPRALQYL